MKCIKLNAGKIIRVNDETATVLVNNKDGAYCPKSEYKVVTDDNVSRNNIEKTG